MPFGLGWGEVILVLVVILLFFGAKRIPEIAGSFGKGIREFKKSVNEVDRSIREPEGTRGERLPPSQPVASDVPAEEERVAPKRLI